MYIEAVKNIEDAIKCDELLTKLILSESEYDKNLSENYIVKNYFENKYENKNNIIYIAKNDENVIIGYAYCKIITTDDDPTISHIGLLDGLYVEFQYRNQGIATKLIDKCKNWCKQIGAKVFELNVLSANKGAYDLYNQLGFIEVEKKMRLKL